MEHPIAAAAVAVAVLIERRTQALGQRLERMIDDLSQDLDQHDLKKSIDQQSRATTGFVGIEKAALQGLAISRLFLPEG